MTEQFGSATAIVTPVGPPAVRTDLLAALAAGAVNDPGDMWNGVARTACAVAQATAGGAVLGGDRRAAGLSGKTGPIDHRTRDALIAKLRQTPKCATWIDGDTRKMYAAASISGDPDTGFLWVERADAPFHWREAIGLRSLAALASLLELLERQRDHADLLLREYQHRVDNDVQMVGSMLSLRAQAAASDDARTSINEAADRLLALSAARSGRGDLADALRHLCAVMNGQVARHNVTITANVRRFAQDIDRRRRGIALIAVNELLTNAIKHAFGESGGTVTLAVGGGRDRLCIEVSDDGASMAPHPVGRTGSGLDLVARILSGVGGRLRLPDGNKTFVIEIPLPTVPA